MPVKRARRRRAGMWRRRIDEVIVPISEYRRSMKFARGRG